MASEEQKLLSIAVKPLLKEAGFKKSGYTWHRGVNNLVHVLNIQGSQWSKSVYVNLGVYFQELGTKQKPSESHCHVRQRLLELAPDRARCNELFDLENSISDTQRHLQFMHLIRDVAVPWLDQITSIEQARQLIEHSKPPMLVTALVKQFLNDGDC